MTNSAHNDEPAPRQHQAPFTIRLPLDLKELIEQRASIQGVSASRVIADLVREAIDGENVVALSRQSLQATSLLAPALNATATELHDRFDRVDAELALVRREQRTGFRRLVGFSSYLAVHVSTIWRLVLELGGTAPTEADTQQIAREIWRRDQSNLVQLQDHAKAEADIQAALDQADNAASRSERLR